MSSRQLYPVILGIVCLVSGLALGTTYSLVKAKIAQQEAWVVEASLEAVLPEAKDFEPVGYVAKDAGGGLYFIKSMEEFDREKSSKGYVSVVEVRKGLRGAELVGYVAEGAQRGYSSLIRVAVGVDRTMSKVVGIKVISQQETPGLGARVNEVEASGTLWSAILGKGKKKEASVPWFQANFSGVGVEGLLQLKTLKGTDINGDKKVDAITGASITSDAVLRAVQEALTAVRKAAASAEVDASTGASKKSGG